MTRESYQLGSATLAAMGIYGERFDWAKALERIRIGASPTPDKDAGADLGLSH